MHEDKVAPHAATVTAALLSVFPSVANDVSLTEGIQSLLAQLAGSPGALPSMAREGVPLLMAQLQSAAQQVAPKGSFLVEGTLDLLSSYISSSNISAPSYSVLHTCLSPPLHVRVGCAQLFGAMSLPTHVRCKAGQSCIGTCSRRVRCNATTITATRLVMSSGDVHSDAGVTQEIYSAIIQPVYHLLVNSGEPNVIQSCCDIFRKFLEVGGEALLTWGGSTEQQTLDILYRVFHFVLQPDNDDSAAMLCAGLALQTLLSLKRCSDAIAPKLLQLLVVKTLACEMQALRGQLLVVITRCAPVRLCFAAVRI